MNNKNTVIIALIVLALIVGTGYKAVFGQEDPVPSLEELIQERRASLLAEQAEIDRDNLKYLSACREEQSKATKASEALDKINVCYNKFKRSDIDIEWEMAKFAPTTTSWTVAPASSGVASWYQCKIGTGSHDVRHMAKSYPWIAAWKNNNTSGITLGSKALQEAFDAQGIKWFVGTKRPANEGNRYYGFPDLENGMKAKLLIIKRSYKDATVSRYLSVWGTDSIPTTLDKNRKIGSLTDNELLSFLRLQIQKESGKAFADYVYTNVITCTNY